MSSEVDCLKELSVRTFTGIDMILVLVQKGVLVPFELPTIKATENEARKGNL
jgi:hypothetical protein